MYSDAALGHGSVLIEVLIDTASSMHAATQSLHVPLFPLFAAISAFPPVPISLPFLPSLFSLAFMAFKDTTELSTGPISDF